MIYFYYGITKANVKLNLHVYQQKIKKAVYITNYICHVCFDTKYNVNSHKRMGGLV